MNNPTKETYTDFQKYYDLLNQRFFEGKLPNCLITYQRGKGYMAYYCHERFKKGEKYTDEIAMNPTAFIGYDKSYIIQTLMHEMVHLWQFHYGKPSRGGYHNKEWAEKMKAVGLQPFGVGASNYGKETGQQLNHKLIEGGVLDDFLKTDSYNFQMWVDSHSPITESESIKDEVLEIISNVITNLNDHQSLNLPSNEVQEFINDKKEYLDNILESIHEKSDQFSKENGSKIKYSCQCDNNIWGKANLKLMCLDCASVYIYSE